ncbi:MAG: 3-phosphoshikimate 1-carboxyvinyltransferase [Anaerolineae bacterium]|nr:3-phosphoshikimate 1-carboxyvinyltransferase [Anaerolineae bacterium]
MSNVKSQISNSSLRIRPGGKLSGTTQVPGDKSISHRSLMLGALADGTSQVRGWLPAGDTLATLGCMRALGIDIERHDATTLTIHGRGLQGLKAPAAALDCVNAGTAMRLMAGIMAGQSFPSVLDGSEQLRRRPMRRITEPLRQMGAHIEDTDGCAPLHISPSHLRGMEYMMPVASGQVKSGILLGGLFAKGDTTVIEPGPGRDHTERMLRSMGMPVRVDGPRVTVSSGHPLSPLDVTIPGDISSAAFLLVAACLVDGSQVTLRHTGINPTRTGIVDILEAMGAQVSVEQHPQEEAGEPVADLSIGCSQLKGIDISGELIVRAIDEFPALMVAATQVDGKTVVSEAAELRVKETDRIAVMAGELRKLGADIEERPDGFAVQGPQKLHGAVVDGHDDHRVVMSLVIAGLHAEGTTTITGAHSLNDSFPGFVETLQTLGADVEWINHD